MAKKITREEETLIPAFQSHREAINWFKDKYVDDFRWVSTEAPGDAVCHFCVLILNREAYEAGSKALQQGELFDGRIFLDSFQSIEIYMDGRIHIVH